MLAISDVMWFIGAYQMWNGRIKIEVTKNVSNTSNYKWV